MKFSIHNLQFRGIRIETIQIHAISVKKYIQGIICNKKTTDNDQKLV